MATKKSDAVKSAMPTLGVEEDLPTPIGVPQGFAARRQTRGASAIERGWSGGGWSGSTTRGAWPTEDIPARYTAGMEWTPATHSAQEIAEIQQNLVAAGLIPKGASYRKGYWDDTSREAYKQLLAEANSSGLDQEQQLRLRMNTVQQEDPKERRAFQRAAYLKPDPATLRNKVRDLMKEAIGPDREPSEAELNQLIGMMTGADRQAFEAEQGVAAAEHAAAQQVAEGAPVALADGQQIDPAARFEEMFRQRYAPEIRSRQGTEELVKNRETLLGGIFSLDQAIGA